MPQQLIYTSAPRGLVAGRSGYCTVARSATLREALMLRLEQYSYYDHLSLVGGRERPVFAFRVIDIRGTRYHVLSRIQDAGLDFTGRTNFIAHHLVATPDEVLQMPTPAMVFRKWAGWMTAWKGEPRLLNNEDWSGLSALAAARCLPARNWAALAGDSVNAYGLLEAKAGTCFGSEDVSDDTLLSLLAESTELLEVRDSRRDFRLTAWQWTFTTACQEQDTPSDFRCRFVPRGHPAFAKLAGSVCVSLPSVRATKWTEEEKLFAQKGWQPAHSVSVLPAGQRPIQEGESAVLQAQADGVPYPSFQWYEIEPGTRQAKPLSGATSPKLEVRPHRGVARYKVEAFNRANGPQRASAEISVEVKAPVNARWTSAPKFSPSVKQKGLVRIDDDDQVLRKKQRNLQKSEEAERNYRQKQERSRTIRMVAVPTVVFVLFALALVGWKQWWSPKQPSPATNAVPNSLPGTDAPQKNESTNAMKEEDKGASSAASASPTNAFSGTKSNEAKAVEKPPSPVWEAVAIGTMNPPEVRQTNGIQMSGYGQGFTSNADFVSFWCQKACSDGELTVTWTPVPRAKGVSGAARFGIMMRDSERKDAAFIFVGASPTSDSTKCFWAYRRERESFEEKSSPKNPNHCLRLTRRGRDFDVSYYLGPNFQVLETLQIEMCPTNYLVGLAVCSGPTNGPLSVNFGDVRWIPKGPPPAGTNPGK